MAAGELRAKHEQHRSGPGAAGFGVAAGRIIRAGAEGHAHAAKHLPCLRGLLPSRSERPPGSMARAAAWLRDPAVVLGAPALAALDYLGLGGGGTKGSAMGRRLSV